MKYIFSLIALSFFLILMSCAGKEELKTEESNEVKAIDLANFNTGVHPGDDFFEYVNGTWMKNNPIPDEESRWGAFNILYEENQERLHKMFEEAAKNTAQPKGSVDQLMGDLYASGMDTSKIEELGYEPIKPMLAKVDAIKTVDDLQNFIFEFASQGMGTVIGLYAGADDKNSSMNIINMYQTGLNLPDRSYYLEDDDRSKEIRAAYNTHLQEMLTLIGETPEAAKEAAVKIFELEKEIAAFSKSRVDLRDPEANYNKMTLDELKKLSPAINWDKYFATLGLGAPTEINVGQTKYYAELSKLMKDDKLEAWKSYFKYAIVQGAAPYLSSDFVNANFDFYGKELSGSKVLRERWKRVVSAVDGTLGEAVGKLYVQEFFPPRAKERMLDLVKNLRIALEARIKQLTWMTEETKEKALHKLGKINVKIGYPDKWRDYSSLDINRDTYFQNMLNATKFEHDYNLSKVGKPIDPDEWHMSPQTVNAYYSPNMNEVVFPAGILQPPFFFMDADDAVNYGGIGVVIGHEITHGFDDQGRLYDASGNLNLWWTDDDAKNFKEKTQILIDQYNSYEVLPGVKVNGELTLGENIADFGGLTISLEALKMAIGDLNAPKIDDFTPLQRFFISYSQIWRQNIRDKELMQRVKTDVHSPAVTRVNGGVVNVPEFYEAFGVKADNKLYVAPEQRAVIW